METLILLLGGNLGDRLFYLQEAESRLSALFGKPSQKSKVYETAAWGLTEQPSFYNQALAYETALPALEILAHTQQIELDLGRIRKERWGARMIDIDILFLGQQILNTPELQLPHPQLHLRRFALVPLAEILLHWQHPVLEKSVQELLARCPDSLEVKMLEEQ
ncbi:2-amino-4-hydroxy-6-hydroxymethyldihydropteridine diphosphokinase [Rufibacter sp. LB8]|uniref:2-amino-4-hydroxy-6- hydroxymethyldihydropteridine diphosphokinase n=1 Tax=Rufibacter sp. LB8 TaxID=2777781 RepID=UPI00178C3A0C|nr:2-amino-4-hydroxy-6-hydroxymethyldihydropteridine diphosphokinase [Rufibacter sp. LB8]